MSLRILNKSRSEVCTAGVTRWANRSGDSGTGEHQHDRFKRAQTTGKLTLRVATSLDELPAFESEWLYKYRWGAKDHQTFVRRFYQQPPMDQCMEESKSEELKCHKMEA